MAATKAKLKAKAEGNSEFKPIPEREQKAVQMGYAYEAVFGRYHHKPALRYFTKLGERGFEKRTVSLLFKAATFADEKEVDYETYVEAQFYWFHRWFRRAPKLYELAGERGKFPARRRVDEFLRLQKQGKSGGDVSSVVIPRTEISDDELDKINSHRLEQLCRAWERTAAEIIQQFAPAGVFDLKWLQKNLVFLDLKKQGKI
jgi:hypothetical protein